MYVLLNITNDLFDFLKDRGKWQKSWGNEIIGPTYFYFS